MPVPILPDLPRGLLCYERCHVTASCSVLLVGPVFLCQIVNGKGGGRCPANVFKRDVSVRGDFEDFAWKVRDQVELVRALVVAKYVIVQRLEREVVMPRNYGFM